MKKYHIIIGIIFIMLTILTFYTNFVQEEKTNYDKLINIGEGEKSCHLVVSVGNNTQKDLYDEFKLFLNKYNGNLFCSDMSNKSGKEIYTKYVYFTDTNFLKNINLVSGSIFGSSDYESNKFLSTDDTKDINQIGQIAGFSGQKHFEIHTFKSSQINNLFERILTVQFKDKANLDNFIYDLNNVGIKIQKKYGTNSESRIFNPLIFVVCISYLIIILIIFYSLLNSYKKNAVEKMLGFKSISIWLRRVLTILGIEAIVMISTSFIMTLFLFKTYKVKQYY